MLPDRSTCQRFLVLWFAIWLAVLVTVFEIFVFRGVVNAQQVKDVTATITLKARDQTLIITFKGEDLANPRLANLVKEKLAKELKVFNYETCENPVKISDECMACQNGPVICTKNATLGRVLTEIYK